MQDCKVCKNARNGSSKQALGRNKQALGSTKVALGGNKQALGRSKVALGRSKVEWNSRDELRKPVSRSCE
jgi:hypothetical protein